MLDGAVLWCCWCKSHVPVWYHVSSGRAQEPLWPARRGQLAQEVRSIIREIEREGAASPRTVAMVVRGVETRGPPSLRPALPQQRGTTRSLFPETGTGDTALYFMLTVACEQRPSLMGRKLLFVWTLPPSGDPCRDPTPAELTIAGSRNTSPPSHETMPPHCPQQRWWPWSPLSAADDICSSVHCCGLEVTSYHKLRELAATRPAVAETWIRMVSTIYYLLSTRGVRPPLRVSTSKCWGNLPTTITVCCSKSPDDTELRDIIRGYSALSAHLNDCQKKQAYF